MSDAVSDNRISPSARLGCMGVAAVVLFAGGFIAYPACRAIYHHFNARNWAVVPCTVISDSVKINPYGRQSGGGKIQIKFSYRYKGKSYSSDRYGFAPTFTDDVKGLRKIVSTLKPGTRSLCHVNINHPAQAVTNSEIPSNYWMGLVIGIITAAGGAFGMFILIWHSRPPAPKLGKTGRFPGGFMVPWVPLPPASPSPIALRSRDSPFQRFIVWLILAAGWDVAVVFIFYSLHSNAHYHHQDLLIVVQVGGIFLCMILNCALAYSIVALFNARPKLFLYNPYLFLGSIVEVRWQFAGRYDRIQGLQIWLEGREDATQSGRSSTLKSTFAHVEIAKVTHQSDIYRGNASATIPAHTMHTLAAMSNKIIWAIRVRGEIPHRPDVQEEFQIVVAPHPIKAVTVGNTKH